MDIFRFFTDMYSQSVGKRVGYGNGQDAAENRYPRAGSGIKADEQAQGSYDAGGQPEAESDFNGMAHRVGDGSPKQDCLSVIYLQI